MQQLMKSTRVITWNINHSHWLKPPFVDTFSYAARRPFLVGFLNNLLEDDKFDTFLCIQETTQEVVNDLGQEFSKTHVSHSALANEKQSTFVQTFIPKNMTNSVVQMPAPSPLADGKPLRNPVLYVNVNNEFYVVNVHLPMDAKYRLPTSDHIATQLGQLNVPFVCCGDFNSFSDAGGLEQMQRFQILSHSVEATAVLDDGDRNRVLKTFSAYPYDVNMPPHKILPYHLDHIFLRGFITQNAVLCNDKHLPVTYEDQRYGASDHFPVLVEFVAFPQTKL